MSINPPKNIENVGEVAATLIYSETRKITKWVVLLSFFAVVPPVFLYIGFIILSHLGPASKDPGPIDEFYKDMPMILLSYWSGTMGAVVSYVYDRNTGVVKSEESIYPMARFLFGGIIGAACFLFVKSSFLIKMLYPKLEICDVKKEDLVAYQPTVALAFFADSLVHP